MMMITVIIDVANDDTDGDNNDYWPLIVDKVKQLV